MAPPPPSRGFIPPTMPPMFSGGLTWLREIFFFGPRCSPADHPCVPAPGRPKGSRLRPLCQTKPTWVCRCPGTSCSEGGDILQYFIIGDFCVIPVFADYIQMFMLHTDSPWFQLSFVIKYNSLTRLNFLSETQSGTPWSTQPRLDEQHPDCEETAPAEVFPAGVKNSGREQRIYERPGPFYLQHWIPSQWSSEAREKWSKDSGLNPSDIVKEVFICSVIACLSLTNSIPGTGGLWEQFSTRLLPVW